MDPAAAFASESADLSGGIERAGVDVAGLHADQRWLVQVGEKFGAHAALRIGWNADDTVATQASDSGGFQQRSMDFVTNYDRELRRAEKALSLDVPAFPGEQRVAGGKQAGDIRHGCAGYECTSGMGRKPKRSRTQPRAISSSVAPTGDITRRAAF